VIWAEVMGIQKSGFHLADHFSTFRKISAPFSETHTTPAFRNRSASALILVLAMVALLSAVVLAFFSSATTERTTAHNQAASEAARHLANNASQIVMAKIADATKGGTAAAPLAWASQPGMIRTYDASGNAYQFHKLYSAANMTVSSFSLADDLPPSNWKQAPACGQTSTLLHRIPVGP
jgi:type II secretory pathway pseudopilin PulG